MKVRRRPNNYNKLKIKTGVQIINVVTSLSRSRHFNKWVSMHIKKYEKIDEQNQN
jgi:hypothetical protein